MNTGNDENHGHVPAARRLAAGSFLVAAAALFALTGSFNDSASAHVKKGSFLERHKGFILNMRNKNGNMCCNGDDAFDSLEEKVVIDAEKQAHYKVRITSDMEGNTLPGGGVWVDIPDYAVLTTGGAKFVCDNMPAKDPDKATCKAPPTNILWASINDKNSDIAGDRITPESGSGRPVTVLIRCYYPKPLVR